MYAFLCLLGALQSKIMQKSYNHHIQTFSADPGLYRLHWKIDRYYAGSRLRHPFVVTRDTDRKGAERFATKHGIPMPSQE
mgnify:CR=1 FL=1